MKEQSLLDKMRNVRDIAEKEIFDEQSIKNSTQSRWIENVVYLGKFEINEKEEELFVLYENLDGKTNYKLVNENGEKIAIKTEQGIIFTREELSVDKMKELEKAFLEKVPQKDLNKMEKEELDKISEELGIKDKDIDKMSEIELEDEKEDIDKEKEIGKEEIKGIRTLQEIKTNIKVDERHTLSQKFNFEEVNQKPESKFVKIAVVHSDNLSNLDGKEQDSTSYSFVAIRQDGSAQRIDDIIEVDMAFGNTNTEETMKFDADETARKDSSTKSRFKIKGTNETLSVENGQYGELKVYYGGKARGSNEVVETQLETRNVRPTSRELRETQSDRKGINYKNEQIGEAEPHFEAGEEKVDKDDADGDKNTKTHEHSEENITQENDYIPGTTITWRQFANECGYRGKDSIEHAQDVFENELNNPKNHGKTYQEIVDEIIEEKETEFRNINDININ